MCKLVDYKFDATDIKGKGYIEVNQRLKAFRTCDEFKGYSMETEILSVSDESILLKAIIKDENGRIIAEGIAGEDKDSSLINKTSYIENCETSAWGRALACLGIGIETSVASKEEVSEAIKKQDKISQPQEGGRRVISDEQSVRYEQKSYIIKGVKYLEKKNKTNGEIFLVIEDSSKLDDEHPKYFNSQAMAEMGLVE